MDKCPHCNTLAIYGHKTWCSSLQDGASAYARGFADALEAAAGVADCNAGTPRSPFHRLAKRIRALKPTDGGGHE